jgi:DNA-binding NarL/FixJ family response regulator
LPKIRILLVDDHVILIDGLRAFLSYYEDVDVVGEAHDGAEAIARVAELQPDIVLMDIAMPGMNGITATGEIHKQYPKTRILILTQHEDQQYVLALMKAGASGYLLKGAMGSDLIRALRIVAEGGTFLYPSVASLLAEELQHPTESLTPREIEILRHIVQGETNSQIGESLSLSVKTIEWHRTNLMNKLNLHNVAELVNYALQHELVN